MTAQWSPVDSDTADLLTTLAHTPVPGLSAEQEWTEFVHCLRLASIHDGGLIHPNALRPMLRGAIKAQRIGAFHHRALAEGLVVYTGGYEISNDREGRNGGKPARIMRWLGGSA